MRLRGVMGCAVTALLLTMSSGAWAQPAVSQADRDAARQAALDGINAFNRQDYATALERLQRAETLFHAPVHMRYIALSLERRNNNRDALEVWRRLAQETLDASAPPVFRDAVEEARRAIPRLEATFARVAVDLVNAGSDATVQINGTPVALADLAAARLVDAGPQRVVARRPGFREVTREVTVAAGATERVSITFEPEVTAPPPPAAPEPRFETRRVANPLRTVGLIAAGTGVAVAVVGAITGVMAQGEFDSLEQACPNRQCPTMADLARRDDVDSLAGTSTALFIGGGVLAAAGAVLFLVGAPRTETVRIGMRGQGLDLAVHF